MEVEVVIAATRPSVAATVESLRHQSRPPERITVVSNEVEGGDRTIRFSSTQHPTGHGDAGLRRNIGADLAEGGILLFLDDDVIASRTLVETAAAIAERDGLCWGHHRYIDFTGLSLADLLDKDPEEGVSREHGVNRWHGWQSSFAGNFAITRERFWEVGGFDLGYLGHHGSEDQQLGRRLATTEPRNTFVHEPPFAWHPTSAQYHADAVTNVGGTHELSTRTINGHEFSVCAECPYRYPIDVARLTVSDDVVIPYRREDFTLDLTEAVEAARATG